MSSSDRSDFFGGMVTGLSLMVGFGVACYLIVAAANLKSPLDRTMEGDFSEGVTKQRQIARAVVDEAQSSALDAEKLDKAVTNVEAGTESKTSVVVPGSPTALKAQSANATEPADKDGSADSTPGPGQPGAEPASGGKAKESAGAQKGNGAKSPAKGKAKSKGKGQESSKAKTKSQPGGKSKGDGQEDSKAKAKSQPKGKSKAKANEPGSPQQGKSKGEGQETPAEEADGDQ